jgi:large subunit ribosomal protein L18
MASHKKAILAYRRKREGKTNYKKRIVLLSSKRSRLVVRITNTRIIAQITDYAPDGDKVLVTVGSNDLKKFGWNYSYSNLPAAYLTGVLVAKKARDKKLEKAILDLGFHSAIKGSKVYAVLKGAIDGKLEIPADESIFPSMERIKGQHIKNFAEKATQKFQFSRYKKDNANPANIEKVFELVKNKILQ